MGYIVSYKCSERILLSYVPILTSDKDEYWFNVSDQNEIPIAGDLELAFDFELLSTFLSKYSNTQIQFSDYLTTELEANPSLIYLLRTLVGVSDKRMYLELSYLFSRTPHPRHPNATLCGCPPQKLNKHTLNYFKNIILNSIQREVRTAAAKIVAEYLVNKGLEAIVATFSTISNTKRKPLIEKLIIPKEVQQKEAKRRGHGAEGEAARVCFELGCQIIPTNKHTNPMGAKDPNLDRKTFKVSDKKRGETWSFDLLILDKKSPSRDLRVCMQALIHTSDPGQYGVNKSNETVTIRNDIDKFNLTVPNSKKISFWGLVDGVGFCENKADTINKMLPCFDTSIQLKSLYKIGLSLHRLGLCSIKGIIFDQSFYSPSIQQEIMNKYGSQNIQLIRSLSEVHSNWIAIEAGKAHLFI